MTDTWDEEMYRAEQREIVERARHRRDYADTVLTIVTRGVSIAYSEIELIPTSGDIQELLTGIKHQLEVVKRMVRAITFKEPDD